METFRALYDRPVNFTKRQENNFINDAETLLKQAIPNYRTLGKVKFQKKIAIYYTTDGGETTV